MGGSRFVTFCPTTTYGVASQPAHLLYYTCWTPGYLGVVQIQTDDVIATPDTKTCYECGLECPIDQFRRRRRGSGARTGRCNGSKFVLNSLRAILRLIEACSPQEPGCSEWSEPECSEEDLEAELRALLASIPDDEVDPS